MDKIVTQMLAVYSKSADCSDVLVSIIVPSIVAIDKNKHFLPQTNLYPQHCSDL